MNNTGITLVDVRNEAMDAIQKLKSKQMDISTAKEVRELLNTVISTAKVQVDFLNALPKQVKDKMTDEKILSIAGTLRDRDAELDETLTQIEKNSHKY
jgi:hypothetical protein